MKSSRLRTLFLYANGTGSQIIRVDTILRGVFGYDDGALPPRFLRRFRSLNLMFAELRPVYDKLSYMADWRDAFLACARLDIQVCNINNLVHYARCLVNIRSYDLIVVSHSAAGDDMTVLSRSAGWFHRRRGKLVVFIGNEYDLLDEKIAFLTDIGAEYVCSQLPLAAARYLYGQCTASVILEMPHALNTQAYFPMPGIGRQTHIGFIGDIYWPFVGDMERTELIRWFENNGAPLGLRCDIRKVRVSRSEWNLFLNTCEAVIGAESGTYYLNEQGRLLNKARHYNLVVNPDATFQDVFDRFYNGVPKGVSGKSISSRHFEPIGTKTCQILLEGEYNGILHAGEHYISVNKDLSNIRDAIDQFRDIGLRTTMVERTYEYVMDSHTYTHRVNALLKAIRLK